MFESFEKKLLKVKNKLEAVEKRNNERKSDLSKNIDALTRQLDALKRYHPYVNPNAEIDAKISRLESRINIDYSGDAADRAQAAMQKNRILATGGFGKIKCEIAELRSQRRSTTNYRANNYYYTDKEKAKKLTAEINLNRSIIAPHLKLLNKLSSQLQIHKHKITMFETHITALKRNLKAKQPLSLLYSIIDNGPNAWSLCVFADTVQDLFLQLREQTLDKIYDDANVKSALNMDSLMMYQITEGKMTILGSMGSVALDEACDNLITDKELMEGIIERLQKFENALLFSYPQTKVLWREIERISFNVAELKVQQDAEIKARESESTLPRPQIISTTQPITTVRSVVQLSETTSVITGSLIAPTIMPHTLPTATPVVVAQDLTANNTNERQTITTERGALPAQHSFGGNTTRTTPAAEIISENTAASTLNATNSL